MNIDNFGVIELNSEDGFNLLYKETLDIHSYVFEKNTANQFNKSIDTNKDSIKKIIEYIKFSNSIEEFDQENQKEWFIPKNYFENLIEWIYSQCTNKLQTDRVTLELELYIKYNMLDVLFYLKYLVDIMRENNIVWGVGRGSSVSSYVLYLIGIHKIDSIKYNLDINEFFK